MGLKEHTCDSPGFGFDQARPGRAYFDRKDYDLLRIVCDVVEREDAPSHKKLLAPYMHPHGIKEMAATRGLRIAYAVVHLLGSLETGKAEDRLSALRGLHAEVLGSAQDGLRTNTGRVLVQLMKDMVRAHGDTPTQLMFARDFREACSGKPRVIRRHLARYHLLEMPEDQSQIAFDDHVHDANTKGRKSATHLVLDAWIKGIKSLTVVYYNHVTRQAAAELLEAARILGLKVRIGIELNPRLRSRFLKLIWAPGGFDAPTEFLDFLAQPATQAFLAESRKVSLYHQAYVSKVFDRFNEAHRPALNREHGLDLPPLSRDDFTRFVGSGQASLQHLGKFIHDALLPLLQRQTAQLRHEMDSAAGPERNEIRQQIQRLGKLDTDEIIDRYLAPARNPALRNPDIPTDDPDAPAMLRLSPAELTRRLQDIHPAARITLSLGNLRVEEVLEILYDCRGAITHLEIVNMKDRVLGREIDRQRIHALQDALNTSNVIKLKKLIREIMEAVPSASVRDKIGEILYDISTLHACYRKTPLACCIGTDSTGQSSRLPGMGMVVADTLPGRTRTRLLRTTEPQSRRLDVQAAAHKRVTELPDTDHVPECGVLHVLGALFPPVKRFTCPRTVEWLAETYRLTPGQPGNVWLLGGVQREHGPESGLGVDPPPPPRPQQRPHPRYLNSSLKIGLKILAGFIPAALTFGLTKDWWVLAVFGAFIWFGITGLRNIIQMVLATGGIWRSSLLRWNDLVSWDRLADSLLYTGFSVPLLDYLIKTLLLNRALDITLATSPLLLYSVMALANGLYIMSHNILRGLPRGSAFGNLFRSVLSIPLALAYSDAIVLVLRASGHADAAQMVEPWAAVISKFASDCVAGFIEGLVDRAQAARLRAWDYRTKLNQLFDTFQQLELLFPQEDVLALLESPKQFMLTMSYEHKGLENIIIVNALDLQYFWMYQPRARAVLTGLLQDMSVEERKVFLLSQYVLLREREISQLFLDGLVGKNFAPALAFYLDTSRTYLEDIQSLAAQLELKVPESPPAPEAA
ncbi:hypothetical protein SAMN04488503_1614 [Humidesulfovibrio mexicanus]|uniref:Uncharacterized protein n=1 Tax=Humidesulfovibrio mexicanus TaxID=147047 RepID=A0A238ZUY9_9BACT|nr:hypothetical protein [Humidesulfovibrio mexicanus]SNR86942.1 hypothetical protein SAMN04488503_1614 [Humidesulfovibrio mexicanus]